MGLFDYITDGFQDASDEDLEEMVKTGVIAQLWSSDIIVSKIILKPTLEIEPTETSKIK